MMFRYGDGTDDDLPEHVGTRGCFGTLAWLLRRGCPSARSHQFPPVPRENIKSPQGANHAGNKKAPISRGLGFSYGRNYSAISKPSLSKYSWMMAVRFGESALS